jgi:hypothetical protein
MGKPKEFIELSLDYYYFSESWMGLGRSLSCVSLFAHFSIFAQIRKVAMATKEKSKTIPERDKDKITSAIAREILFRKMAPSPATIKTADM